MGQEGVVSHVTEGDGIISVAFKQRSLRYLNEFVNLSCAPDMLSYGIFPDAKEITESFAAYEAVRKYMWPRINPGDPNVVLVSVGDGATPRTAATFTFRTKWRCCSIDPNAKPSFGAKVARLHMFPCKIEELTVEHLRILPISTVVLVAVHSHANLEASVRAVLPCRDLNVVAIPCCFPQNLEYPLVDMYHDWGIHSPHRLVKVWTRIKGEQP